MNHDDKASEKKAGSERKLADPSHDDRTSVQPEASLSSAQTDIAISHTGTEGNGDNMGRPQGKHNEDYEQKRAALLEKLGPRIVDTAERASFRELAALAGVSVPTLRHYFGDRNGLLRAWLELKGRLGAHHLTTLSSTDDDFATSVRSMLRYTAVGMDRGRVIELHTVGLAEGLTNPALGPTYLQAILEPTLAAAEMRLAAHIDRGEMRTTDIRSAALSLLSPLLLAILHQRDLGGDKVRCLDLDAFIEAHSTGFVRAYGRSRDD